MHDPINLRKTIMVLITVTSNDRRRRSPENMGRGLGRTAAIGGFDVPNVPNASSSSK
jgi:hypothetical protein